MRIDELTQFEMIDKEDISDIRSEGYILRHKKSGARICVISNDDDNKVFFVGFRTTPWDETGAPHIIEHTVLCGSEKFPVKDPFVELVKGSLNTFLNAITYPDKTLYPIGSCNDQDFRNLMDVYLDAVFHPNITKNKEIFMQEGWHYELESEDAPLSINGIVYNEMKGAYSSPETVLHRQIVKSLFPDNSYRNDSGGNPEVIPSLSYEEYIDFYKKYYHPSNSYIYLYGNMDVPEILEWMDKEYLSEFDYLEVDSDIPDQEGFTQVKDVQLDYSISEDDSTENKAYLSYNRVVGSSLDKMLYIAFDIIDYALISSPGAPVKQALIDAGIGDEIYGSFDGGTKQMIFSVIAKNANDCDKERFIQIIEDTFKEQIEKGILKDSLMAGLNSYEFKFREADFGAFPKGLLYGIQCMDSWLFDDKKPFIHLQCLETFAELKRLIQTDYYEQLIQKYFLDNTHGSTVVVTPNPGKNNREEKQLEQKLADYKASLSKEEIDRLIEDTKALKLFQETPSTEEELRKLPMLSREDLKREANPYSNIEEDINGIKVVRHDVESTGIHYISLIFDVDDIKEEDIEYFGIFSALLGYIDTENYSYSELSNAINIYSGGIYTSPSIYTDMRNDGEIIIKYELRIKVLNDNLSQAMMLADEIMRKSKFEDIKRITEIIAQSKSRLQMILSSSGNIIAAMRSLASSSKYALYQEKIRGIACYRTMCRLEKELKENPQQIIDRFKALYRQIFAQNRLTVSYTGNQDMYQKAAPVLGEYLGKLKPVSEIGEKPVFEFRKCNEGFTDGSQIQYVARTGDFKKAGFEYTGALRVLRCILSYEYLWLNVRVLGGAYGCDGSALRSGETYFTSYRDPNLEKTNEVYDRIPQYLREFNPDERDMTKYIIGTFSSMDTPLNPDANGARSMSAYIQGFTYEELQKERDQILDTQPEDIRALADLIQAVLDQNNLCVIGNENKINQASDMFDHIEKLIN